MKVRRRPQPPPRESHEDGGGGGGGSGGSILGFPATGVATTTGALSTTCIYASSKQDPDITGDGTVDIFDFNALMVGWGTSGVRSADITHDCTVGIFDFNALMVGWSS
jgi:hypothetical protein